MYTHETQLRVRYGETDQMGYVYYGNYALYYEVGRVEALRNVGIDYRTIEEKGTMLPVLSLQIKYIRPATYDDLLTIKTQIMDKPSARIQFQHEVYNSQGTLLNKAEVELVFVDMQSKRPCPAPQYILDALAPYFD